MKLIISAVAILFLSGCQQIYFALTTMMNKPSPVEIAAPKTEPQRLTYSDPANTVTLLINKQSVYAYPGNDISKGKKYSWNGVSLRLYLLQMKQALGRKLFVAIKSSPDATYKNTVDILDEMTINDIKLYSLLEMSKEEENFINQLH